MSFSEILASMGELGELGENPRLSLVAAGANKRRIRPGDGDEGEQFAPIRPAFAQPNPAPIKEIRPIRPFRPNQTEKSEKANVGRAFWHWRLEFEDRPPLEVFFHPERTRSGVAAAYPDAILAEPIPEPPKPVLSPSGKWYFTPPAPTK